MEKSEMPACCGDRRGLKIQNSKFKNQKDEEEKIVCPIVMKKRNPMARPQY